MAQRRMTSLDVIDTDAFLEMPVSSQLLYFHLNARADDDGFVASPRKIAKAIGAGNDDLKVLLAKKFVIEFQDGVCVIKHWRINNFIRKDIYKETQYLDHKQALFIRGNGAYTQTEDGRAVPIPQGHYKLEDVNDTLTQRQLRLGKGSEGKNNTGADAQVIETPEIEEENTKPKKEPKYPNAKEVFSLWGKYPKNWDLNTTQLRAAENLFEEQGVEGVRNALAWVETLKDVDFCPQITSPYDLDSKWAKFEKFVEENS